MLLSTEWQQTVKVLPLRFHAYFRCWGSDFRCFPVTCPVLSLLAALPWYKHCPFLPGQQSKWCSASVWPWHLPQHRHLFCGTRVAPGAGVMSLPHSEHLLAIKLISNQNPFIQNSTSLTLYLSPVLFLSLDTLISLFLKCVVLHSGLQG